MNEKTENRLLVVLVIILIIAVIALVFSTLSISKTGMAETTRSQVVIQGWVAITMSDALRGGIDFGSLNPTDSNMPASQNNDDTQTLYNVEVSTNSNTAADICIRDDMPLCTEADPQAAPCDGDSIPNINYDWSNSVNVNDDGNPAGPPGTDMDIVYLGAGTVPIGGLDYFRFWLSVPGAQAAGTYRNTVYFQGVPTGTGC